MRFLPATVAALLAAAAPMRAHAVEVELRPMHFAWTESLPDRAPIRERGTLVAAGVSQVLPVGSRFEAGVRVELWGGRVDYEGYGVQGWTPLVTDTGYLGTREELHFAMPLDLSGATTLRPLAGVGHRGWQRSRSDETWNCVFARLGARLDHRVGAGSLFVEAGALVPLHTRVSVDWSGSGYGTFALAPRNLQSPFAAFGVRVGGVSMSLVYEQLRFGRSADVPVGSAGTAGGAVIDNASAYQPDTTASTLGVALQLRF